MCQAEGRISATQKTIGDEEQMGGELASEQHPQASWDAGRRVKGGCHSGLKGEFPRRVSKDGRNSRPRSRGYGKEFASLLNRFSHCMGSRYQLEGDAIGSRDVL